METTAEAKMHFDGHGILPCTVRMGGKFEMMHPISGYKWTKDADSRQVVSVTFSIDGKSETVTMGPNYVEIGDDGVLVSTMFYCERIGQWRPNEDAGLKDEKVEAFLDDDENNDVIDLCGDSDQGQHVSRNFKRVSTGCENVIVVPDNDELKTFAQKSWTVEQGDGDDEEYFQFVRMHASFVRAHSLSNYVPTMLLTLARPFDPAWMVDIAEEQAKFNEMSDCDVYAHVCNTSSLHWPRETIRELVVSYVQTLTGDVGEQVELLDMHERSESQFSWEPVKASREEMTKILAMMDSIAGRKTVF